MSVLISARPALAALELAVESENIRITDASPGGQVVVFGVVREPHQYYAHVLTRDAIVSADAGGLAVWASPSPIPQASVWCAVDLATGRYAIAAPPRFLHEVTELPLSALRRNGSGATDAFELDVASARFLVVRPRTGAWTGQVSDGGPGDTDGKNDGKWHALFENVLPIGDPKKERPKHLLPHDVLVLVDSYDLDEFVAVQR